MANNDSYVLLYENHCNKQLKIISQQPADHKFIISIVLLSASGI